MSLVINNGLSLEMAHIIVIIMVERWEREGRKRIRRGRETVER